MSHRGRGRPGRRLVLTIAALASLIVGYYLGQYWQRKPLAELSAIVYPAGKPIDYPHGLDIAANGADLMPWRLFVTLDTRSDACRELLRHYALVMNRLAAWPQIQSNLRLTALAYDNPTADLRRKLAGELAWLDLIGGERDKLDSLSSQLGITPLGTDWCSTTQANAVLVSPQARAWALIPLEQPAIMARNLSTIIEFVE